MITFSKIGHMGRIGNEFFQIASTIGIAKQNGLEYGFPVWKHSHAFKKCLPYYNTNFCQIEIKEDTFHYDFIDLSCIPEDQSVDLNGYFQSEKYWKGYEQDIKKQFEFTDAFISESIRGYEDLLNAALPVIAIHVRRGDYVDNPNYVYLRMAYYHNALREFGDLSQYSLLIFSDDIEYCKTQFESFENAFYAETLSPLHDLCLMTQCHHFICSNSTFSWWGSYLGAKDNSRVLVPDLYFSGKLEYYDTKDFWHSKCKEVHIHRDFHDTCKSLAIIPLKIDSKDRQENIDILMDNLYNDSISCSVDDHSTNEDGFHRTKILNGLSKENVDILINWDADCLVPYFQIMKAIELIESGQADFVYPYTEWCKVPRSEIKNIKQDDPGFIRKYTIRNKGIDLGGCIVIRKQSFINAGMENENFKGYGCEDKERYIRWITLGYKVKRIPGKIFHLEHWRGENSDSKLCSQYNKNLLELSKVALMKKEELKEYIKTWKWVKA